MLKNKTLMTGTAIGVAVAAGLYSVPALAAGTTAGTVITNEVTVNYQVGGVSQTQEEASNNVTVDRKVDLSVAASDNTATSVSPGSEDQAVTFEVVNLSNDSLDFALSAAQVGGDDFDPVVDTDFRFYADDGDGVFDGGDTLITHIDALAADDTFVVHVVTDSIPLDRVTGDIASITLTATARTDDGAATLGAAFVVATSDTVDVVDTLYADVAGVTDGVRDGAHSANDDYEVLAALLSATKSSTILSNGANFNTGTALPGATIEYCITVSNASGGATATNVTISDDLPDEVTFDTVFDVKVGGATCAAPGTDDGDYDSVNHVVSGTIASLPAGDSQTLIFRAVID